MKVAWTNDAVVSCIIFVQMSLTPSVSGVFSYSNLKIVHDVSRN